MLLEPGIGVAVHLSDLQLTPDTFNHILPLFPKGHTLNSTEELEVYHGEDQRIGIMFGGPGGSLKLDGRLISEMENREAESAAASLVEYICQECAETLKKLWIHDVMEQGGYAFVDPSRFKALTKLVIIGGGEAVFDRVCGVLSPRSQDVPDVPDVPSPKLRRLVMAGIADEPQLARLITLCKMRSNAGSNLFEVLVSYTHPSYPPEWMTRACKLGSPASPGLWVVL